MNTNQLFEAIGEVDEDKLLHAEQPVRRTGRGTARILGILAAVVATLAAMTMLANAATNGAVLNQLRVWINGKQVAEEDCQRMEEAGQIVYTEEQALTGKQDYEVIAARTDEGKELIQVVTSRTTKNGSQIGMSMRVNRVEEKDGRILLHYGDVDVDLTEQLSHADACVVDFREKWVDGEETRLLITVRRDQEHGYLIFSEPAN